MDFRKYTDELPVVKNELRHIIHYVVFFLTIALVIYLAVFAKPAIDADAQAVIKAEVGSIDYFANLFVEADVALVYDLNEEQILYEKFSRKIVPLASLTKVMSALVARELAPTFTIIDIEPEAIMQEGDTGLFAFERWKLGDILDLGLMVSSNDAMAATAMATSRISGDHQKDYFIDEMNKKARDIGMYDTTFKNETGLDLSTTTPGAVGTAHDMMKLFGYVLKNDPGVLDITRLDKTQFTSASGFVHDATNTNVVTGEIAGLIASKTGFTDLSGGNLIIAFDASVGRPVIVVVLGSSINGRFVDILALADAARAHILQE